MAKVWMDGKYVLVQTERVNGALVRLGTYDRNVLMECNRNYAWLPLKGARVLDIGANCGYFCRMAYDHGATRIVGVEPEPSNYDMLRRNCEHMDGRMVLLNAAAVVDDTKKIDLYLSSTGKNPGNASLYIQRGRSPVTVPATSFQKLLKDHRVTVLKIDAEGAEYSLLTVDLPKHVRHISAELHLGKAEWRSAAETLMKAYKTKGWRVTVAPTLGGKLWHTMVGWSR